MEFFETSAKTGKGVEDAFSCVAKKLMSKKQQLLAEKKEKARQKPLGSTSSTADKTSKKDETSKIALDSSKTSTPAQNTPNSCC